MRGGSPNELPPPRRRGYQRTGNGIPPTQRQWRKRDHGSLKRKPPETEGYPRGFYPRNNISAQVIYPVVPHLPKISTGLPFLFRSPEPLFLLRCKRKSGFGPCRAGKKQLQDKSIPLFPQKKRRFHPQDAHPIRKAAKPGNIRPPLPKTTHPGGVDINEQGTVFQPLNGSGAKGITGRSNAGRRKQEGYPKVFYPRDNQAGLGLYPVVP